MERPVIVIRIVRAVCEECYGRAMILEIGGVIVGNPTCPICHTDDVWVAGYLMYGARDDG